MAFSGCGFLRRIFGISLTKEPSDSDCWRLTNGQIEIDLARAPELKEKGTAIRLEKKGLKLRVLLVHGDDGRYYAFHNRCTHAGRRVDPLPGTSTVQCCSVGKSTWDYEGKLLSGSAKEPLPTFPVKVMDGEVIIKISE